MYAGAQGSLEDFALAWLVRWTSQGGSVSADPGGDLAIYEPAYHYSPARSRDLASEASGLPNSVLEWGRSMNQGWYEGSMRELLSLLAVMPDGRDAVRAVIEEAPQFGRPRASVTAG